mmetsp:Transcript_28179/g.66705  ORF Transcript_28179/g.66705 Transcript_28179/m.66705 type:complete len:439 (+) Transcript_28179:76-1392(+)
MEDRHHSEEGKDGSSEAVQIAERGAEPAQTREGNRDRADENGLDAQANRGGMEHLWAHEELILDILSHLDVKSVCGTCSRTCRSLRNACQKWFPWRATSVAHWKGFKADQIAERFVKAAPWLYAESAVTDLHWAVSIVPNCLRAGTLLCRVGAYVEAKQVLALCLQPGAEGYKEEIVEKTFPELLDLVITQNLQPTAHIPSISPLHASAYWKILTLFASVTDQHRCTFHFYEKMMSSAAAASTYASKVVEAWRAKEGVKEEVAREALLLHGVNRAWQLLGHHTDIAQLGLGDTAYNKGVQACEDEVKEAAALAGDDPYWAAKVQEALGVVAYTRAAFLFDDPRAAEEYARANEHLHSAITLFSARGGADQLEVALCCVGLGISNGNRRRCLEHDMRAQTRSEAVHWYYRGYTVLRKLYGDAHPLTMRAKAGYLAHEDI